MPVISESNKNDLIIFKNRYIALPRHKRWFFPRSLGRALWACDENTPTVEQTWRVFDAYLNKTSLSNQQKFSCTRDFSQTKLFSTLSMLHDAGLLSVLFRQTNFNAILECQDAETLGYVLITLHQAGLLEQANFNAIVTHKRIEAVASALYKLDSAGLFTLPTDQTQAYFDAIVKHRNPSYVASVIIQLQIADLLSGDQGLCNLDAITEHQTPDDVFSAIYLFLDYPDVLADRQGQANFNVIVGHQNPGAVARGLIDFYEADMLSGCLGQVNRAAIVGHEKPDDLANALVMLHMADLLSGKQGLDNRDVIVKHPCPGSVSLALRVLSPYPNLLSGDQGQANFNVIVGHKNPSSVAHVLIALYKAGLLEQDNRDAIARHPHPHHVIRVLHTFDYAGLLLDQSRFNAILTYSTIFFEGHADGMWARIPDHLFTDDVFHQMIRIAEQYRDAPELGQTTFSHYVNFLIRYIPVAPPVLNDSQSTHTTSIHQSVSESATKLLENFRELISSEILLQKHLEEVSVWVNTLPSKQLKHDSAKRCIERIKTLEFKDPGSGVSVKQLLALAWLAIHAEEKTDEAIKDAKLLLIDGLYEIQRGYNLSDIGVDNKSLTDLNICPAGTFNKLVEKLYGIHSGVQLVYVTKAGATAKFQIVVREEAIAYFALQPSDVRQDLRDRILGAEGIEAIWANISDKVANRLLGEFESAYPGGNRNIDFKALMATGIDVSITDAVNAVDRVHPNVFFQAAPKEGNKTSQSASFRCDSCDSLGF